MTLPPLRPSAQAIDDLLPQTECRQCGFDGCAAYAQAVADGLAPINRCAPGGARGIAELAKATGLPFVALDPEYGTEMPFARAQIRAEECIGCSWCVRACPTDAIGGSPKHLHAVLEAAARAAVSALRPAPWTALTSLKSAANGRGRMPAKQNVITRKPGRGASVRQPWRTPVLHADAKQRLTYRQRPLLPLRPPPRKTSWRTFWRRLVHVPANKMICDGSER